MLPPCCLRLISDGSRKLLLLPTSSSLSTLRMLLFGLRRVGRLSGILARQAGDSLDGSSQLGQYTSDISGVSVFLADAQRFLHFLPPKQLQPVVELCPVTLTSPETVTSTAALNGGGVTAGTATSAGAEEVLFLGDSWVNFSWSPVASLCVSQFGFGCSFAAEAEKAGRC